MSEPASSAPSPSRGRGKSRGGLGKYLRARGRGRGRGRPAEFTQRLVLENEQEVELDEDEVKEMQAKYAKRNLGSNADRYEEPEPDPEEEPEPEVDLSAFLARQRAKLDEENILGSSDVLEPSLSSLAVSSKGAAQPPIPDDDIDHELGNLMASARLASSGAKSSAAAQSRKQNKQVVEWDDSLEAMRQEKTAAEAMRDLKTRLQGSKQIRQSGTPTPLAAQARQAANEPKADTRIHPSSGDASGGTSNDPEAFLDDLLG